MIQISEELFVRLCKFHLLDDDSQENKQVICDMLTDKLNRINKRLEYKNSILTNKNSPVTGLLIGSQGKFDSK